MHINSTGTRTRHKKRSKKNCEWRNEEVKKGEEVRQAKKRRQKKQSDSNGNVKEMLEGLIEDEFLWLGFGICELRSCWWCWGLDCGDFLGFLIYFFLSFLEFLQFRYKKWNLFIFFSNFAKFCWNSSSKYYF